MSGKIDGQMMQKFQDFTKNSPEKKVSQDQAKVLMTRAQTVDRVYTGSCSSSKGQGSKSLQKLVEKNPDSFTPESRADIKYFFSNGKIPTQTSQGCRPTPVIVDDTSSSSSSSSSSSNGGGGFVAGGRPANTGATTKPYTGTTVLSGGMFSRPAPKSNVTSDPSVVASRPAASTPVTGGGTVVSGNPRVGANTVVGGNVVSSGSAGINRGGPAPRPINSSPTAISGTPSAGNSGTTGGRTPINAGSGGAAASVTTPNAGTTTPPRVGGETGITTPNGTRILDFKASRAVWHCNWWPQQERLMAGGDPRYNLYAMNGPLHKLDMVTGGSARDYEYSKHRKSMGDGPSFSWWGHCNDAAQSACIFQEPKRSVTMTARDGSQVTFTPNDIQGLLVKASSSLITSTDFKGNRYNGPSDDPNEPSPDMYIQVMQEWAKDGLPFVYDIDPTGQVWNYPYDEVQIDESDKAPQGFNAGLSSEGTVKYYHIHAAGTGYPDQVRNYQCYIQRNASGAVIAKDWIKTPNTKNNPDFMWRPHPVGNIMDKSMWQLKSGASNPNIDMGTIYDIYAQSIA